MAKKKTGKPKPTRKPRAKAKAPKPPRGRASTPKQPKPAATTTADVAASALAAQWMVVNRVQLAALLGVHADTVSDYNRQGMPVRTKGGPGVEGDYDAVACLNWWRQTKAINAKDVQQTRLFAANAGNAEIRLKQQQGELVSRADVLLAGQAFVAAMRAKLLVLATRAQHTGIITREQVGGIAALLREALTEIAAWKTVSDAMDSTQKDTAA